MAIISNIRKLRTLKKDINEYSKTSILLPWVKSNTGALNGCY